ncbi:MAG: phytanoyl-CoA dioxygenase family protein [Paracoccaceae bacterium]|nr:phytanoyl-CoA dioxygenase family protein [Paracoccaceae bacterium]
MLDNLDALAQSYARDGYVFPNRAISAEQAADYRARLEAVEAAVKDDPARRKTLRRYANVVLDFVDEITRLPAITDRVAAVLGEDLLVLDASFFIKEAQSPNYVTWHQDLHYWGLDGEEEVTAWLALSPATCKSGCMRFVPGSHRQTVDHRDTFDEENLLTRGQELAVEVDERDAVDVELAPGEFSLHHGRVFHASDPNSSDDRRIGLAIRYIVASMKTDGGAPMTAMLVRGQDRHGNFTLAEPPEGVMTDRDMARYEAIAGQRTSAMFKGAERS